MRIKEVNIVNFKGFQNETVTFNGNLTVVIGNNTAGKTTLLLALVASLEQDVHLCVLNNPILYRDEFFSYLAKHLGLGWDGNKAMFLIEFGKMLKSCHDKGERVLLIFEVLWLY